MSTTTKFLAGWILLAVAVIGSCSYSNSGLSNSADDFLQSIRAGDSAKAHGHLSQTFKKGTPVAELNQFIQQHNLIQITASNWHSYNTYYKTGSAKTGTLGGDLTFANGSELPARFVLVEENDVWKIAAIRIGQPGASASELAKAVPDPDEVKQLVQNASAAFGQAVSNRDMGTYYHTLAQDWQRETTPAELRQVFQNFLNGDFNLQWLHQATPQITGVPTLDESGWLTLQGEQLSRDATFEFKYTYVYEGLSWKVIAVDVSLKPLQQHAANV